MSVELYTLASAFLEPGWAFQAWCEEDDARFPRNWDRPYCDLRALRGGVDSALCSSLSGTADLDWSAYY